MDIHDDSSMQKELDYSTEHISKIVEKTNKSLTEIHANTQKAQTAILNKDNKSLSHISDEMIKMQEQISFLQKELFS